MKNYEKYADEIKECEGSSFCNEFVIPHILKPNRRCDGTSCDLCHMLQMIWLMEEYEEPEVDWSKVEVDTPILVKDMEHENWRRRYFAAYKDGEVYAWVNGKTSWSANDDKEATAWSYVELADSEEGGAE